MRWLLVTCLTLLAALPAGAQDATTTTLVVTIQGIQSTDGQILVAVHDDPDAFPGEPDAAVARQRLTPVTTPTMIVRFEGLKPGTYAVAVVHDENANGVLDTRAVIPVPKEPLGISKDARNAFGPPKFDDAKFTIAGPGEHAEALTLKDY